MHSFEVAPAMASVCMTKPLMLKDSPLSSSWPSSRAATLFLSSAAGYCSFSSSPTHTSCNRVRPLRASRTVPPSKTEPPPDPTAEPEPEELPFKLPGLEPDFWEGRRFNTLGFVVQYLWAIGILVALIGAGIAAKTYNFGATDFKETAVYKEALESQVENATDSQDLEEFDLKNAPSLQQASD